MPSRLSSLLVRDGLVGVKRMEKAFQRQVIYGGSLDTILLEMGLVPEERLTQYLALASGLPPAARHEGEAISADALAAIDKDLALKYRAIPLAVAGEAVRILVCSPLELDELEDLADHLDRPLQPLITPEYRWHLVYAHAYATDPPARFTTLARTLETEAPATPVGRGAAVIVDEKARRPQTKPPPLTSPVQAIPKDAPTLKLQTGETVHEIVEDHIRSKSTTLIGVVPNRAAARRDGVPDDPLPRPVVTFTPATTDAPRTRAPSNNPIPAMKALERPTSAPPETTNKDSPLPVVRARELLATVEDRDTCFLILLRAARSRARWAGLLTVQGGAVIGRVALAEPGIDVAGVGSVLIPLDVPSPFRTVVSNKQPHIGTIASGDPAIDAMLKRLGGTVPPSALVMPIVLRDRVVALVVAHRVHTDTKLPDVTELLPLAGATADALGRLIVRAKSAGYRVPAAAPDTPIEVGDVTQKIEVPPEPEIEWREPTGEHQVVDIPIPFVDRTEDVVEAPEPTRAMDDVLTDIETAKEAEADDAIGEAFDRAPEALAALMRRFPGKLRVDRFAVSGRALRAAQYGGLLELVIQLGSIAAELLIEKMAAPQRDVRFYATVCAAELRPRSAVYALVERVFDQDYGVRAMAIEALSGYPIQDLAHAMVRARRAVHSDDAEVVLAATSAIVQLGDTEAIGELISVVEKSGRIGEHVRKALTTLTAQDFGANERKWRRWWETSRTKHRVEWLIDGLAHKEDAIREQAISDLRRLTGEYFGYHHDLPRKEREAAASRWATWWREAGHRRFVLREDERARPTAVLPVRREPT